MLLFPVDFMQSESVSARWTFADLASTYRFWALIAIWALPMLALGVFERSTPSIHLFRPRGDIPELWEYARVAGFVFGAVLGMLLVRAKRIRRMAMLAAIGSAGYLIAWLTLEPLIPYLMDALMYSLTAFLGCVMISAFTVAITLMLADAAADRFAFGVAFVVLSISLYVHYDVDVSWLIASRPVEPLGSMLFASAIAMGGAVLLLATVRPGFDAPPITRHKPLIPAPRSGDKVTRLTKLLWVSMGGGMIITFLAPFQIFLVLPMIGWSFVAVLAILSVSFIVGLIFSTFWIYRIHGEVAYVQPSAKLFTPRAALLFFLIVPLSTPLLLLSLHSVLQDAWAQRDSTCHQTKSRFGMWCLLFPPIAMGMIQEQLNELVAVHTDRENANLSRAGSDSGELVA